MKYQIIGENMQVLQINLESGERIYSDAGKLVSKDYNVKMTPRMKGGIIGAISRDIVGASAFLTEYEAQNDKGSVMLAATLPGKILGIELGAGEAFYAEHYAFLGATDTVSFSMQPIKISAALFGGAGFLLQKFIGPGTLFLHFAGGIIQYDVDGSKPFEIDPGHVAGFTPGLEYKITFVDNLRSMVFGGVGMFLAKFEGKGKVMAHSISRYKLSNEIYVEGRAQNNNK